MRGGAGDDCMDGGAGRDNMFGNAGNDTMDGGSQRDVMNGGIGDDFLYGNAGNDVLRGDSGQTNGGEDVLLGGRGNDRLFGGKDDDCLIADEGNDTLTGGADGDDFVFGHNAFTGAGIIQSTVIGKNVITDFDDDNSDRIVFHSAFEGTLSAEIDGDDVLISSSLGGSVLVKGLVSELEGIDPSDPFFDSSTLIDFLTKTGEFEAEDGKGVIFFEDKGVTLPDCDPDQAEVDCDEIDMGQYVCEIDLDDTPVGNTSISTTEERIADLYVDEDANVSLVGNLLTVDLLA